MPRRTISYSWSMIDSQVDRASWFPAIVKTAERHNIFNSYDYSLLVY